MLPSDARPSIMAPSPSSVIWQSAMLTHLVLSQHELWTYSGARQTRAAACTAAPDPRAHTRHRPLVPLGKLRIEGDPMGSYEKGRCSSGLRATPSQARGHAAILSSACSLCVVRCVIETALSAFNILYIFSDVRRGQHRIAPLSDAQSASSSAMPTR